MDHTVCSSHKIRIIVWRNGTKWNYIWCRPPTWNFVEVYSNHYACICVWMYST